MTRQVLKRTPAGDALTALILDVFRLNGSLLSAGDRLVAGLGITSARWQVLGAIAMSTTAQPVAWLARGMGLNRQGVQRIVNELVQEGLVRLEDNPNHRRATLVVLGDAGHDVYRAAERLQVPWVNALSKGMTVERIVASRRTITEIFDRLRSRS